MSLAPLDSILSLPGAAALALGGATGLLARGLFAPRSRLLCDVVWRASPSAGPRIAMTFDDGPWPGATEPILDALAAANARASFFVIGRYARAHPGLIRRIAAEGHLIGNHTFDHDRTGLFRGTPYWTDQLQRTDDAIAEITGTIPRFFRPPMGFKSPPLARAVRHAGHTVVAWSKRGFDGAGSSPDRIVRAAASASAGDIVLLHDGRDPSSRRDTSATPRAFPRILAGLRARHLEPVRLDEIIAPC